jgi:hypothetical protein
MNTTPTPAAAHASCLVINELALSKADAINLGELLDSDIIADTVVRSICIIRKTLLTRDLVCKEDQMLEAKLTALYHALGIEARDVAHQMQRDRLSQASSGPAAVTPRPLPLPLPPVPPAGPKLELTPAIVYAREVLVRWRVSDRPLISNEELFAEIAKDRDQPWHPTDLLLVYDEPDDNLTRWQLTVALAMKKLQEDEQVMWSAKRNLWVILDDILHDFND